jgi:hypothetical protein
MRIVLTATVVVIITLATGIFTSHAQTPPLSKPIPLPLERDTYKGKGEGDELHWLPSMKNPGLAGFHFNLVGAIDKEIELIRVLMTDNRLGLHYHDDPYYWQVDRQQLPVGTRYYATEGCSDLSAAQLPVTLLTGEASRGVPVLTGFNYLRGPDGWRQVRSYADEVHSIEVRLLRWDRGGVALSFDFSDWDWTWGGPSFCYRVTYAMVPEHKVVSTGVVHDLGYPATGGVSRTLNAAQPVLQGFRLSFVDDDGHPEEHELDEIKVLVRPGAVDVRYNDKNDDDKFEWTVWYADVEEWRQAPRRWPYWK